MEVINIARASCHAILSYQVGVANKFPCQPQERLLEIVIGLGGDVVILEVLLAMKSNCLCLDFALLHIDLVASENNGDLLADTDKIAYTNLAVLMSLQQT